MKTLVCQRRATYTYFLKGVVNVCRRFEELLCEHVDITLPDVTWHFVFGRLSLVLQFTLGGQWLKRRHHLKMVSPDTGLNLHQQLEERCFLLLTLTAEWTAGGGAAKEAGLECAKAKAGVGEGLRASAGMSTAAGVRHL